MVTRLAVDQSIDAPTTCEPYWSLLECQYVEDVDDIGLVHAGVHRLLGLIPAFSSSMRSWQLHDVHEPQSALPVSTRSMSRARPATSDSGAGTDALPLSVRIAGPAPKCFATPAAVSESSRNALSLRLSRMAIRSSGPPLRIGVSSDYRRLWAMSSCRWLG